MDVNDLQAYGSDSSEYDDESDDDDVSGDEEQDIDEDIEGAENGDTDELLYVDDLYCVACNKAFKNESSYENHESSKKHRENTERLKKRLQAEEKMYKDENKSDVGDIGEDDLDDEDINDGTLDESDPVPKQKLSKKAKKNKNKKQQQQFEQLDGDDVVGEELETNGIEAPMAEATLSDGDDDIWNGSNRKGRKGKNSRGQQKTTLKNESTKTVTIPSDDQHDGGSEAISKDMQNTKNRPKKVGRVASSDADPDLDIAHTCVTCKSEFDSKNKLFTHLKKTNHGVYLPKANTSTSTATESRKSKKK